jgi:hypothetical protein
MPRDASNSPGARALRLAGYVKLPAWWVTQEQFELIEYMCQGNLPEISKIKQAAEERAYAYGQEVYNAGHDHSRKG